MPARAHSSRWWDRRPHRRSPRGGGASGRTQVTGGASADGRGERDAPRLAGARVDGGLLAPAWVACAAREARVRRCARIWSITDAWVMNATMRMAPWQVGHASESTSNICCSRVAHRRLASVGARRGAATMAGGAQGAGSACRRMPRGRLAYQPSYRVVTCPLSGIWTSTRARNSSGSTVSVPAVGPSDLSERYVTAFAVRSYVSRSSATGFRAQYRASRVANARSSSDTRRGPPTPRCAREIRSAAT